MKNKNSSVPVIIIALMANIFIAVIKAIVALISHSTAMLAESIHSFADTFNQIFLLIGIKKGLKKADKLHPFGFSGELYFWSFIVAIMLFTAGSVFSIYEGIHKLNNPVPLENIKYAFIVLGISVIAESIAFSRAVKKINKERKNRSIFRYLRETKKSELLVIFLEDSAAITGLFIAATGIFLQYKTGILIFDGIASIIIGILLGTVAFFLGNETRSLLVGESADFEVMQNITNLLKQEESINRIVDIKSLQMGPNDIMIAVKIEFNSHLNAVEISNLINGMEKDIRSKYPEIKKIFIEPDIYINDYKR